jgi:predicted ArsR family transcriptional regulator
VLVALAEAGGELTLKRLARAVPRGPSQLARLVEQGLVEVGDEVQRRRAPPTEAFAVAAEGASAERLPARAAARRALLDRIVAAGAAGIPSAELEPRVRAHLKSLVDSGLARVERRAPAAATGGAARRPR